MLTTKGCKKCAIYGKDHFSKDDGKPHSGFTYDDTFSTAEADKPTNINKKYFFAAPANEICNTAHPDGATAKSSVETKVKLHEKVAGHGVEGGLITAWTDPTNFLSVQLAYRAAGADCSYLQFWGRDTIAGGRYLISRLPIRGLTLDEEHELHVCRLPNTAGYNYATGDTLRAYVKLADGTYWGKQVKCDGYDGTGFTGGAKVGLILSNDSLSINDSQAYFDDFEFDYFKGTSSHKSCPDCNTPCEIFTDTLQHGVIAQEASLTGDDIINGAIVTEFYPLTCFWGVITGTARFTAVGLLEWMEVESGAKVMCRVPHPQAKTSKRMQVQSYWEAGVGIKLNTGCGYAIFTPGSGSPNGTIKLYDNAGTLLATKNGMPEANSDNYTFFACYANGILTASMDGAGVNSTASCVVAGSDDTGDPYVYLESAVGTVHYRNFELSKHLDTDEPEDNCQECCRETNFCDECFEDKAPQYMAIKIPALVAGTCINGDCADLAGTYIGFPIPPGYCDWTATMPITALCSLAAIGVINVAITGTTVSVNMSFSVFGGLSITWEKTFIGKPHCAEFLRESIPFKSVDFGTLCVSDGSPVLLTAV